MFKVHLDDSRLVFQSKAHIPKRDHAYTMVEDEEDV